MRSRRPDRPAPVGGAAGATVAVVPGARTTGQDPAAPENPRSERRSRPVGFAPPVGTRPVAASATGAPAAYRFDAAITTPSTRPSSTAGRTALLREIRSVPPTRSAPPRSTEPPARSG